jgi:hypothetical protein
MRHGVACANAQIVLSLTSTQPKLVVNWYHVSKGERESWSPKGEREYVYVGEGWPDCQKHWHREYGPGCTSLRKKVPGCTSPRKKVKHVQATNGNHSHDRSAHWPQVVLEPHLYDQVGVGVVLLKPFGQFGQPARVTPHQIHTKNWELPPSTMSTTVCLPTTWPFPRP